MGATPVNPWDRQPGETARAWEAFTTYRDDGPARSLRRTADRLGKSHSLIEGWSVRWAWVSRCAAWDEDQERARAVELAQARRDATRRHVDLATAALERVATALEDLDPEALAPSDLIRWLDIAVRVERQALGMPDRIDLAATSNPVHARADLDGLTPEERRDRLMILRREIDARLDPTEDLDDLDRPRAAP